MTQWTDERGQGSKKLLATPADPPSNFQRRSFCLPLNPEWAGLFNGVISLLTRPELYSHAAGTLSIETVTQVWQTVLLSSGANDMALIGSIVAGLWETIPYGMLPLDGSLYSQDDYPELFAILPAALKSGTDFTLPDVRGRFLIPADDADYQPLTVGGEIEHELTTAEMPVHRHGIYTAPLLQGIQSGDPNHVSTQSVTTVDETADAGSGQAHNNMPPYIAVTFAIVAKVIC